MPGIVDRSGMMRFGSVPRRLLTTAAWGLGFIVFFALNLRLSQTTAANSDGASQALQAWDLLHGNLLQHGWITGDVAYFPNDVFVYALIDAVHGLNADAVHWYGALMYTLAMLLAALLAMGQRAGGGSAGAAATSRERWVRGAIAAGIMIAPQLDAGVYALLQGPDHFGTSVPVLLAWLILDRCPRRWYIAVAVVVIIGVTGIADLTTLFTAALPLAVVCAYRAVRGRLWERQSLAAQRQEILLAAAGIVAGVLAVEGPRILIAIGSLTQVAPITAISPLHVIFWRNFRVTGLCLLVLAGADFLGVRQPPRIGFEILHLAGAVLGGCAILFAAWRFLRDKDLIAQLLLAGIIINLGTFVAGTHASEITFTHEMSDVLPFAAVLAGRLLARRLLSLRLAPVLVVVLCGYLAGLGYEVRQPAVPAQNEAIIPWLKAHNLTYGLSGYWAANVVTLASGEQVTIRALNGTKTRLPSGRVRLGYQPVTQLVQPQWYDPSRERANFVVFSPTYRGTEPFTGFTGVIGFTSEKNAINQFGPPAKIYHFEQYTIYVWNKNLLADMTFPTVHAAG
ncbi:MAG TPA: hypothetical protein VI365_21520 [Trebonia sp.]